MADFKGEKLISDLKSKKVYYYIETEKSINQLSREVFKSKDEVIHYPRGFDGGAKYKTIKKFTYKGFKGKLPVGVYKSENYGWGFTKTLNPFADYIDDNYKFVEIIIEKGGKVEIDSANNILYLSETALEVLKNSFVNIYQKNKKEVDNLLQVELHRLFPKNISKPVQTYISNALATSLASWGNSISEFSEADKEAIKDLFDKLTIGTDFLTADAIAKTKEIIDNKYIKEIIVKYKELLKAPSDTEALEKKWQAFLKSNSWIFSSIFAQPVILYKDEAYVGGKTIENKNGKFNDFLIKNSLSDNVSFLEIKTHKTKLVEVTKYRGEDVYCASKELTGCITQVLNQRDNFQKEFYQTKVKSLKKGNLETFNSRCVILIGTVKDLDETQRYSFELFRSNSKDVEILTFDELKLKIESLQKLLLTK